MKDDESREAFKKMVKGLYTSLWMISPILLGFMAFSISISLGCFIAGFSGIIVLIKKEIPTGLNTIRGTRAIIEGLIITILFWG
jgi:hypothetical protein